MARNEEKAQSMLYRFREVQMAELGLIKPRERRPYVVSEVTSLPAAEKWRTQVLRDISRKLSKIQDASLTEYQVRDLNDLINRLLREKSRWEDRIRDLGGPDYRRKSNQTALEGGGAEIVGGYKGYRYFGRAKELPGVKELLASEAAAEKATVSGGFGDGGRRSQLSTSYFGLEDEQDKELLEYEQRQESQATATPIRTPNEEFLKRCILPPSEGVVPHAEGRLANFAPSQAEVEEYLVELKRKEMIERFLE